MATGRLSVDLMQHNPPNGSWIVQKGDSGGPVYWSNGSGHITAVGIIWGESGSGQGSTRVCFTDIYADLNGSFRMTCSGGCS